MLFCLGVVVIWLFVVVCGFIFLFMIRLCKLLIVFGVIFVVFVLVFVWVWCGNFLNCDLVVIIGIWLMLVEFEIECFFSVLFVKMIGWKMGEVFVVV